MTPILTREEEHTLARVMQQGRDAARQRADAASADLPMLDAAIQAGHAARQQLITANLPLVAHVVGRSRSVSVRLSMQDRFQEGVLGLITAVDRFDPTREMRLSTYAVPWIKGTIQRAIDAESPLACSDYARRQGHHLRRLEHQLVQQMQRQPTDDELAEAMGCSLARLSEVRVAVTCSVEPLDETITQPGEDAPMDESPSLTAMVTAILDRLPPREALVLRMRYGLDGDVVPVKKAGDMLGISPRRVRQLEQQAKNRIAGSPMETRRC